MTPCPACQTMLTRDGAPHRDITGTPCAGLPHAPVCTWCGKPVGYGTRDRAGLHYTAGELCRGSDRRVTTPDLWAARPENLEHAEEAAA